MRVGTNMTGRVFAAKLFAAAGAICLVGSFALASLLKPWATLAELLLLLDHRMLLVWDRAQHSDAATWVWMHMVMPLMERPAWLVPTGMGLVCVGAATTFAWAPERARR